MVLQIVKLEKLYLVLAICLIFVSIANAQTISHRNAIRAGVDYMVLSTPDDVGLRYLIRYDYYTANNRVILEGSLGYLSAAGPRSKFPQGGQHRQRITGEVTVLYNFLKNPSHALRIGVGPSIWQRKDDVIIVGSGSGPSDPNVNPNVKQVKDISVGAHTLIEYEYSFNSQVTLAIRGGAAYLDKTGPSSMIGLNIGYKF